MSAEVFAKLAAIVAAVALGWVAGRRRWLGGAGVDPARVISQAAFTIFIPALLFRTSARLDLAAMPWAAVAGFFVPALLLVFATYAVLRLRAAAPPAGDLAGRESAAAMPSARAIATGFGNSVQVGIPVAGALWGEAGLGLHVALVSLHALVLLSVPTMLAELDLARVRRAQDGDAGLWTTLAGTVRNTVVHPVVLPVLAGLAWNALGAPLPAAIDGTLALLGTAVAPLCLVLIGLSLATTPVAGSLRGAAAIALVKLVALPALALAVARLGFGLSGLPLAVVVMMAALPTGANALIFAQRYRAQEAETTTAIVVSTVGFAFTAPAWLAVLAYLG